MSYGLLTPFHGEFQPTDFGGFRKGSSVGRNFVCPRLGEARGGEALLANAAAILGVQTPRLNVALLMEIVLVR
jgi:hypothetical protein